jgi:radical SAM protein with 4Fe4S-binding SPASM domain
VEDKYLMDGHKLFWHLDRVNAWVKGERIAPLHIDLGITTGCNMACSYCYGVIQGRTGLKARYDMPKDALIRLLSDAKNIGVRSIAFIGEGENTLNGAFYDGLNHAKEINLNVSLATNGILIEEGKIKEMLSSLSWLRFNISASNPESFFKIHRVREFNTVVKNIRKCVDARKRYGLKTTIGMQMVIVENNIDDIIPLSKLGKEVGVDYLVFKPCSDTFEKALKSPVDKYLEIDAILKESERYSGDGYLVIAKRRKLENLGIKDFKVCYGTQFIIAISGNGNVFPCGHFFNIRTDEFKMGNIIETSFKDVVFSDRYREIQRKVQSLDVNRECETNCRQYYINQFLWKLKNPPDHVNFI